jgi:hypothetical protein
MTTTLRLSYQWPSPWVRGKYDLMQRRLDTWCHAYWWFSDGRVEGEPFQRLDLVVTVAGRDRWWCLQRGLDLASDVYAVAGIKRPPFPTWETEKARR